MITDAPHAAAAGRPTSILSSITITTEDVLEAVSQLRPFQNPGPDGTHPLVLETTAPFMAPALCRAFQRILDSGVTPRLWKMAHVTPVHKGHGARADHLSSYRPIASTSVLCRTFERILNTKIRLHLDSNGLLSPSQHGFRCGRSCETALGTLVHTVSVHLDDRTPAELN